MASPARATDDLLEREGELAELTAGAREAVRGTGRVAVVEGDPGIGKSALLAAAAEGAAQQSMTTLTARAGELEREFAFGVARQLFEGIVRGRPADQVFTGQARFAAAVLGLEAESAPRAKPPLEPVYPAVHGLYWMTVNLAEREPLALLVDDAQWADGASLRYLAYLARRLEDLPVLVVVATRPGERARRLVHRLGDPEVIRPGRLSSTATARLVRSVAPQADDAACRACFEATGGNAFYVREVAAALRDGAPDATHPERVTRVLGGRIAALEPAAREVARACAVLGDGAGTHRIAALAGLADEEARTGIEALRAAGVLGPEAPVQFTHPIVRAAVESSIPPALRAGAHAQAARLEAAAGAAPGRVAAHLMAAEPAEDPWAVEQLGVAAREALARGAPEAAARYLERALEEPPAAADRPRLLLELGTATAFAFRSGAAGHVRRGFDLATEPDERLQAALLHAHLSLQAGRGVEGLALLTEVLGHLERGSPTALMVEGFAVNFSRAQLSARQAAQPIVDRLRERGDVGPGGDPSVLIAIGAELAMEGRDRARAVELARAALDRIDEIPSLARAFAGLTATRTLIVADEHAAARAVLEHAMDAARERGALFDFVYHAVSHANLAFRAGDLFASETDARSGYEIARAERWPLGLPAIAQYLTQALTERGELDEARAVLAESGVDGPAAELSDVYTTGPLLLARARLALASGNPDAALADLAELRRRQEAFGEDNPALSPWRSLSAQALVASGDRESALEPARDEVERARRWGAPRALGVALRAAAEVEGDAELLREAVDVLEGSFARLEHGRALADLGDAELASGDRTRARALLREALELAHVCGAAPLEERVLASLHAAGARPRRAVLRGPDALTPAERRVAELAAAGLSNRDVAERLFVTVRTVEYHLRNAYRKLGIDGRSKLDETLGDAGGR